MNSKVALIIGAGTSLGSSITKVFADDNFTVPGHNLHGGAIARYICPRFHETGYY